MNIVIMGSQGSGKGTQARMLVDNYGLQLVEMGALLRSRYDDGTEFGKILKKTINEGEYVASNMVNRVLSEFLDKIDLSKGLIFDAYPRKKNQLLFLDNYFEERNKQIDIVLVLLISEEIAIDRLSQRIMSKRTGRIYNLKTNPPGADENKADLFRREDDYPDAIRSRLAEDAKHTKPLIDIYRERGLVVEIDATRSIEEVYSQIVKALEMRNLVS